MEPLFHLCEYSGAHLAPVQLVGNSSMQPHKMFAVHVSSNWEKGREEGNSPFILLRDAALLSGKVNGKPQGGWEDWAMHTALLGQQGRWPQRLPQGTLVLREVVHTEMAALLLSHLPQRSPKYFRMLKALRSPAGKTPVYAHSKATLIREQT